MTPKTISELLGAILPILPNATLDEDNSGQIIIYTDLTTQGDDTLVPFAVCDCCGLPEDTLYDGAAGGRLCDVCIAEPCTKCGKPGAATTGYFYIDAEPVPGICKDCFSEQEGAR